MSKQEGKPIDSRVTFVLANQQEVQKWANLVSNGIDFSQHYICATGFWTSCNIHEPTKKSPNLQVKLTMQFDPDAIPSVKDLVVNKFPVLGVVLAIPGAPPTKGDESE